MISIFTPTYNRAHTIDRVWHSLLAQTNRNFEWIIVDDGSKDDIEQKVSQFLDEKVDFPILFHKMAINKGKHEAINKGVKMASGDLFLIADSDDAFEADTVDFFLSKWEEIKDDDQFCSIRVRVKDQFGNEISDNHSKDPFDCAMQDAIYKYNYMAESWSADRTDLMRLHPFPLNHKGIYPEGIIWKKISRNRKIRFFSKILRTYYIEDNSLLRNNKPRTEKIDRNLVSGLDIFTNDIQFFWYKPLLFLKNGLILNFYSLLNGNWYEVFNSIPLLAKTISIIMLPISFLFYIIEKIKAK